MGEIPSDDDSLIDPEFDYREISDWNYTPITTTATLPGEVVGQIFPWVTDIEYRARHWAGTTLDNTFELSEGLNLWVQTAEGLELKETGNTIRVRAEAAGVPIPVVRGFKILVQGELVYRSRRVIRRFGEQW